MIAAVVALASIVAILATPELALAWGPPTHVYLGSRILADLALLPITVRELLTAYPGRFLYGNLSPDITQAKEYIDYNRHCHNWEVGFGVLDRAREPELQAFALGYLSHLAADTIAHNVFVPRQLAATPIVKQIGHAYWEYRFDTELGDEYLRMAREIVTSDHEAPDALLESAVHFPLFSFQTNKRIFQNIIHLSNRERWNTLWVRMADGSKWPLPDDAPERFVDLSLSYIRNLLSWGVSSEPLNLDPTGREPLSTARRLRRETFRSARRVASRELATTPAHERTLNDAVRLMTKRPLTPGEIESVAREHFPEPQWPDVTPAPGSESRAEFWTRFMP